VPADTADSGERFCRPGGALSGGKGGEWQRESRASYRCGD
jgi:hypothetical protein